jgi:hypothetical protein
VVIGEYPKRAKTSAQTEEHPNEKDTNKAQRKRHRELFGREPVDDDEEVDKDLTQQATQVATRVSGRSNKGQHRQRDVETPSEQM